MKQMKVSHTQLIVERDKTIATLKEENESQRNGFLLTTACFGLFSLPKLVEITHIKKSTEIIRRTSIAAAYLRSM